MLAWHTRTVFYQTYGPLPAAYGPFSFSRTFHMLWANLFPSLADRFHSSGPRVDFSGHSRLTCGPLPPLEDLFAIACVAHVGSILSNIRTSARRVRTFFVLADLLYVLCGHLSLARAPFSFIGIPTELFWSLALRVRTIYLRERSFFYCLRGTRGQYSINRTELCPPRADLFRTRGPYICYG